MGAGRIDGQAGPRANMLLWLVVAAMPRPRGTASPAQIQAGRTLAAHAKARRWRQALNLLRSLPAVLRLRQLALDWSSSQPMFTVCRKATTEPSTQSGAARSKSDGTLSSSLPSSLPSGTSAAFSGSLEP